VSRNDGGKQPDGGASKYGRDHRDHARDRSVSLPGSAQQPLDLEPVLFDACVWGWLGKIRLPLFEDAEQIWGQLGRLVEVVAPQQRDPPRVTEILDPDCSTRSNVTSPVNASVGSRTRPKA
jgi:hypothetical protein